MMKGKAVLALSVLLFMCTGIMTVNAAQTDVPYLNSIEFKNAVFDTAFDPAVTEYTLTLTDSRITPTLQTYSIGGNAELFVTYSYDDAKHQNGIVATLEYASGSTIYRFKYSNNPVYEKNSENHLSAVYCTYGEISPKLNDKDTKYLLYIPSDMTSVDLTPVTKDLNAYAAPVDMTLSETQEPEIVIAVTASDGSVKEYRFTVKRVDKTLDEIKEQMKETGYTSFVEKEKIYQTVEFKTVVAAALSGIIILAILFAADKRIIVNAFDPDEKPFYKKK